jgi:hypothetical protein
LTVLGQVIAFLFYPGKKGGALDHVTDRSIADDCASLLRFVSMGEFVVHKDL